MVLQEIHSAQNFLAERETYPLLWSLAPDRREMCWSSFPSAERAADEGRTFRRWRGRERGENDAPSEEMRGRGTEMLHST